MAIGLRDSGFSTDIIGVEASESHAKRALELGLVNRIFPIDAAIAASDLIIVATRPSPARVLFWETTPRRS